MKRSDRGFTLVELTVALAVMVAALLGTLRAFDTSAESSRASRARSDAIDATDEAAARLAAELLQSSADLSNPSVRRYWILADGVRFQRVVGVDTSAVGFGRQLWSEPIEYTLDAASGELRRREGATAPRTIATGISRFVARATATGEIVVSVAALRRAPGGRTVEVLRERRVTPRSRAT